MPTVTKIHGFQRADENFSSHATQFKLGETVLIEADRPDRSLAEVVDFLPSVFSGPGGSAFNPHRLTFTLAQSRHPYSDNYYLESLESMTRDENEGQFWVASLTYSTPLPAPIPPAASGGAKKQRVKKADGKKKDQKPIINPMERPPEWDGDVKTVMMPRWHDLQNRPIYHTNGLPISKPVSFAVNASMWTWSWNVSIADFPDMIQAGDIMTSSINRDEFTLTVGNGGSYVITKETMACLGFKYSEEFETPSGSKIEYHYVRVTGRFMFTEGVKLGLPPISMHTKQISGGSYGLINIPINERETEFAKEPWPLKEDGRAVPWDEIDTFNRDDYGKLKAGGEDLTMRITTLYENFFTLYGLKLPFLDK